MEPAGLINKNPAPELSPPPRTGDSADVRLTVVIPVYNCGSWVIPKLDQVIEYFLRREARWELIVVDDGSQDDTAEVIRNHFKELQFASLLALSPNRGKGAAVMAGLRTGRGVYRLFMDCDLAYPLTEASKLIEALESGADVAVANRRLPESICQLRPFLFKQVYSRYRYGELFNHFIRFLGLTRSTDTQAGLKGIAGETIKVLENMTVSRFAFDIELLHLFELHHKRIIEVPIVYGFLDEESSIKIIKDGWRMVLEVFKIKLNSVSGRYKLDPGQTT